jgi:hypothetical protein
MTNFTQNQLNRFDAAGLTPEDIAGLFEVSADVFKAAAGYYSYKLPVFEKIQERVYSERMPIDDEGTDDQAMFAVDAKINEDGRPACAYYLNINYYGSRRIKNLMERVQEEQERYQRYLNGAFDNCNYDHDQYAIYY